MIYFAENSKLKTISGFDLPGGYLPEVSVELALRKKIENSFLKLVMQKTSLTRTINSIW